jgi:GNAT superfamily N-acetyltransferase
MIRAAGPADAPAVSACLARAFHGDPLWGDWAFPEEHERTSSLGELMGRLVTGALPHGWVWMSGEAQAVAVWLPPGAPELSDEQEREFDEFVGQALGARAGEMRELFARFEGNHPHEPPHYYLSLLGTDPAHAGRGIGMQLLRDCLARIDGERMPVHLESTNPVNVPRYEALGFVRAGAFECPAGGPEIATMWRAAR